jgi:hypothetical protein
MQVSDDSLDKSAGGIETIATLGDDQIDMRITDIDLLV